MEVLRPGDPGYEAARKPAIARFHDVRPAAVARCRNTDDVAAGLALARDAGLPVAVRSGGHCFAGRSSTTGAVIDVAPMDAIAVQDGEATVGAGARLGTVYAARLRHIKARYDPDDLLRGPQTIPTTGRVGAPIG